MADSFFLEPDDSKSLGDIDYMRTVKRVRRTYAKYKNVEEGGMKITKSVSATDDTVTADPQYSTGSSFTQSSFTPSSFTPSSFSFSSSSESTTASSNGSSSSTTPSPAASETPSPAAIETPSPAASETPSPAASETPSTTPTSSAPRVTPDTSMDMFRKMAKDIRR